MSREVWCGTSPGPGEQRGKEGGCRHSSMEWDKQEPVCSSLRSRQSIPAFTTSLVYFSEGTVSKPLVLLCTPTCGWPVLLTDNATVVWLWACSQA